MNATISIADMLYFNELVPICILNKSRVTYLGFNQTGELNPSASESFLRLLYMFSLQNIFLLGQQKVAAPGLHFASRWWFTSSNCPSKGSFQEVWNIHHVEEPWCRKYKRTFMKIEPFWQAGRIKSDDRLRHLQSVTIFSNQSSGMVWESLHWLHKIKGYTVKAR